MQTTTRIDLIAQKIIGILTIKEDLHPHIKSHIDYFPETYSAIARSFIEKTEIKEARHIDLLNAISLRTSFDFQIIDEEKINREFQELIRQLQLEYLRNKRQILINSLKEAENEKDEQKIETILHEFDEMSKLMQN